MSDFSDAIATDPPRMVVLFRRAEDGGSEQYQWGLVHSIPILTLIGSIVEAQSDLVERDRLYMPECDESAFVMVWNAEDQYFSHFKHPTIPPLSLVGMLDIIKATLIGGQLGQNAAAQRILGPDGSPLPR
jgi:hypothetical protein